MPRLKSPAITLFLLGYLTLFLELVLIRYLAGNIWNLGYFPNLVLLGVFIGMGIGFVFHHLWSSDKANQLYSRVPYLLLFLIVLVTLVRPYMPGFSEGGQGVIGGELYFTDPSYHTRRYDGPLTLAFWFITVVLIFT